MFDKKKLGLQATKLKGNVTNGYQEPHLCGTHSL